MVSLLLSKSTAMIHVKDKRGRTGIMLASANGHLDMVTLLVGQGADINASDKVLISLSIYYLSYKRLLCLILAVLIKIRFICICILHCVV